MTNKPNPGRSVVSALVLTGRLGVCLLMIQILGPTSSGWAVEEPRQSPDRLTLFDFSSAAEASWRVVNDGVMGGRSQGYVEIEEGALRFTGTLVTQGGGFTSVRADRAVDLSGFAGLELKVRGGGRTFEVEVDDGTRRDWRTVSRRASFATDAEWALVRVPFSALRTTVFGQSVSAPPIDLTNVKRIGLYILDGIDGSFRLEVDSIRAYRAAND
jgi:hypothetical protein